ncbi:MAG: L-dopachrome tautomerase-related protein [Panacagrimonas sp.]
MKYRYGGGADFPDRSTAARLHASALEIVTELDDPPGNIAVSSHGRVFVSLHPWARPEMAVVEIVDGHPTPFPDQSFLDCNVEPNCFRQVLGIRIDRQNRLWTLDTGKHGWYPPRLLAFDLNSGLQVHAFEFGPNIAPRGSHLNDLQVSADGLHVIIADASILRQRPALIVYDVLGQTARRVLENHPALGAEKFTPVVQRRRMELFGLFSIRPGVGSIALDRDGQWLYLAPPTNLQLYRLRLSDLLDPSMQATALAGRVQSYAAKTMSAGISTDDQGRIYLTDFEHSAITMLSSDRALETLIQDATQLRWPNGLSFGPDGDLYVTASALHQVLGRSDDHIRAKAPFAVLRLKAPGRAHPGH